MFRAAFSAAAICRVGDTATVQVTQGQDGTWSYPARILWVRDHHLGLTPPTGAIWQQLLSPGKAIWLAIPAELVSARLRLIVVGLSSDLPSVLVLRQAQAAPLPPRTLSR